MSIEDKESCAICNRPKAEGVSMWNVQTGLRISCSRCGAFEMDNYTAAFESYGWNPELRAGLSCAARQAYEEGQTLRITSENASELAAPHLHTRVSDNLEQLLQIIAKRATRPNNGATFNFSDDFPIINCFTKEEFKWYVEWAQALKLAFQTGSGLDSVQLTLSMDGWNRVQPLPMRGGIPGRCFVAMWFSNETKAAYEHGIEPAITNAGFTPLRIDMKEHNNEIPDEIMAEIRNAQFVVADFTGQRNGVYYEAGFAMGLGRPVIWCCRDDQIKDLHFDTNHKNHIAWSNPLDLQEKLYKRIQATIIQQR